MDDFHGTARLSEATKFLEDIRKEFDLKESDCIILGKYRITLGRCRVAFGKCRVTLGKCRVTLGKYRVTLGK